MGDHLYLFPHQIKDAVGLREVRLHVLQAALTEAQILAKEESTRDVIPPPSAPKDSKCFVERKGEEAPKPPRFLAGQITD